MIRRFWQWEHRELVLIFLVLVTEHALVKLGIL